MDTFRLNRSGLKPQQDAFTLSSIDPGNPRAMASKMEGVPSPEGALLSEFTEDDIVNAIVDTLNHEHMVRQTHEAYWNRAWERVNGRYDFSRKMAWQSKKSMPEVLSKTLRLTWEISKPIVEAGQNWFSVKSRNREFNELVDIPVELVKMWMYPTDDAQEEFDLVFYDMVFSGLIFESMAVLVLPKSNGFANFRSAEEASPPVEESPVDVPAYGFGTSFAEPPKLPDPVAKDYEPSFRVQFVQMNPRLVWRDSTNRKRYVLWAQSMTPDEFRAEAEERGWKYVEEVIASALAKDDTGRDPDAEQQRIQRDADNAYGQGRRDTIHLSHQWGYLYNGEGKRMHPTPAYYILANKKFLVWGPEDVPFWHKEVPLISSPLMRIPFSTYAKSLISAGLDPMEAQVEILNMMLDYLQQAINPPTEVDEDLLSQNRKNQLGSGIAPGKMIYTEKKGANTPAIMRAQVPEPGAGVWNVLTLFGQQKEGFIGMGDTAGAPRSRNRISAQEFKERSAMSGGLLRQIFKNIKVALKAALRQAYLLGLQYMPQDQWAEFIQAKIDSLQPVPPPEAAQSAPAGDSPLIAKLTEMQKWGPRKRYTELGRAFSFECNIYDALENRRERLEKLGILTSSAQGNPMLASRLKWHKVADESVRAVELDPAEFLWPDEGETQDQPIPPALAIQAFTGGSLGGMETGGPPELPTSPPGSPPQIR